MGAKSIDYKDDLPLYVGRGGTFKILSLTSNIADIVVLNGVLLDGQDVYDVDTLKHVGKIHWIMPIEKGKRLLHTYQKGTKFVVEISPDDIFLQAEHLYMT